MKIKMNISEGSFDKTYAKMLKKAKDAPPVAPQPKLIKKVDTTPIELSERGLKFIAKKLIEKISKNNYFGVGGARVSDRGGIPLAYSRGVGSEHDLTQKNNKSVLISENGILFELTPIDGTTKESVINVSVDVDSVKKIINKFKISFDRRIVSELEQANEDRARDLEADKGLEKKDRSSDFDDTRDLIFSKYEEELGKKLAEAFRTSGVEQVTPAAPRIKNDDQSEVVVSGKEKRTEDFIKKYKVHKGVYVKDDNFTSALKYIENQNQVTSLNTEVINGTRQPGASVFDIEHPHRDGSSERIIATNAIISGKLGVAKRGLSRYGSKDVSEEAKAYYYRIIDRLESNIRAQNLAAEGRKSTRINPISILPSGKTFTPSVVPRTRAIPSTGQKKESYKEDLKNYIFEEFPVLKNFLNE